jgi:mannose-6-phosphate isomerase-like protein (cupin superfamily)
MFYQYDSKNTLHVPKPFQRDLTPIFQAGDAQIPDAAFSISMAEWDEGGFADPHIHEKNMEAMYCIAGKGTAQIGENIYELKPDTLVVAPIGVMHQLKNTGKEKLRVICIYSPAITTEGFLGRAMEAIKALSEGK